MFPIKESTRHLAYYNPKTGETKLIRTCFNTHHLVFARRRQQHAVDQRRRAGSRARVGWLNRKVYEETGDEAKAQGWTPIIIDTNGNGKRDDFVQPNQPVDPTKDKRINAAFYGIGVNPADGTIWGNRCWAIPGYIIRLDPRPRSVQDRLGGNLRTAGAGLRAARLRHRPQRRRLCAAVERPPGHVRPPQVQRPAQRPAGRRRQAVSGRLDADPVPGPAVPSVAETGSAEASYYTWVDQFNTAGSRRQRADGDRRRQRVAARLVDGKWVNMRVPYPLGFFAKWMDGRIDDPNAGWKGRGLWTTYGNRTPFHIETGKGTPAQDGEVPDSAGPAGAVRSP